MWVRDKGADPMMEKLHTLEKAPFEYSVPEKLADGWECASPESVGIDRIPIVRLLEKVSQGAFNDFHGILIIKNNKLVVEEYFANSGKWHGVFINSVFRDRCHHLASTTKCITSTLVGIAIDQGFIESVHEPIMSYLPGYVAMLSDGKEDVTIEHLLTMSSGIKRTPSDGRWLWVDRDVAEYILDQPLVREPGQQFVYSNGSAALVGVIMENATGMTVDSFAEEFLFRPLGITDYIWTAYPDGTVETEGGLALRPRDLARIGQAFLQDGRWNGEKVIPADWVVEATKQRMTYNTSLGQRGYGYFWMERQLTYNDTSISSFFHFGDGGQLLMVFPELDMVIVLTGGGYGGFPSRLYNDIIYSHLLPSVSP